HMYPQTLYGHIVTTIEIMSGIFLLAVMTGLIFVRFSRPSARVVFSNPIVIAPLNGKPTLMVRVGNENQHSMVEAEFRIMFSRDVRFGERFVEMYTEHGGGRLTVDYGRLHDTEQMEFAVHGNGYGDSSTTK